MYGELIRKLHNDHGAWGYITGFTANPWWHLVLSAFWVAMAIWLWHKPFPDLHMTIGWFAFYCLAADFQLTVFLELVMKYNRQPVP